MKKYVISLLIISSLVISTTFIPSKVLANELSIRDFINLLVTIGVITPDKMPAVNTFLSTLDTQNNTDVATTTGLINSISIKAESNSARVDWKTSTTTESKVFIEGGTYFSKRGVGTSHYVNIGGLEGELEYTGTITANNNNVWESKDFNFITKQTPLKITLLRQNCPSSGCIFSWETNYKTDSKIKIFKKTNNVFIKTIKSSEQDSFEHQVEFRLEASTDYTFEIYADSDTESAEIKGQFRTEQVPSDSTKAPSCYGCVSA
jgi:hypothetical protein